jgi:hypothetical protein
MQVLAINGVITHLYPVIPARFADVCFDSREVGDQKSDGFSCGIYSRQETTLPYELGKLSIKSDLAQHGQRQPVISVSAA